jgi:hypothetical protein
MTLGIVDRLADLWLSWRAEQNVKRHAPQLAEFGIRRVETVPGGWQGTFVTPAAALIADDMARMLDASKAENYLQFDFLPRLDREGRPVRVTVQWAHGKAPGQVVAELKDEISVLRAALADDEIANKIATDCHDPAHDPRSCSRCEARLDGIDEYRAALGVMGLPP